MPDFSRVVIVHTAEHIRAVLEAASTPYAPVVLQSAPGAVAYAGSLYLLNLFAQVKKEFPKVDAIFVLDCEGMGAESVAAMHAGHTHLRISTASPLRARIAGIAQQLQVMLVEGEYDALDLAHVRDIKNACRKWLAA